MNLEMLAEDTSQTVLGQAEEHRVFPELGENQLNEKHMWSELLFRMITLATV